MLFSTTHFPAVYVLGCRIIAPFQFMVALRQKWERGRRAFQHAVSRAMLLICSDSHIQSLFIQLDLLSKPDPQFWHACVVLKLMRIQMLYQPIATYCATYLLHEK